MIPRRPISASNRDLEKKSTRRGAHRDQTEIKGWIFKRHQTSREAAELAHRVVEHLDDNTKRLFFHLIICFDINIWEEGWTPVSSRLIHSKVRGASWKRLAAVDYRGYPLIEYTGYSRKEELSREFRVSEVFMSDYRSQEPVTYEEAESTERVDLFTGKPSRARTKTLLKDENNNYIGKPGSPVYLALRYYKDMTTYYWRDRVEQHLEIRRHLWETAYEAWKASGDPKHTPEYEAYIDAFTGAKKDLAAYRKKFKDDRYLETYGDYQTKYLQFRNDELCYRSVLKLGVTPASEVAEGVYAFRPAYRDQMSGRVGCPGGLLQSCSREMKYAAFYGIPGLRNYDLKASQPTILLQKFMEAIDDGAEGIDPTWLRGYIGDPKAKEKYANLAGLTIDTWKGCFIAVIMGATLPEDPLRSKGELVKELRKAVGAANLQAAYQRLDRVLRPFYDSVIAWHEYLVGPYLERHGYNSGGGRVISNEAGMVLAPYAIERLHKRKSKMAAFLLQGLEAAYIHTITILGPTYGYAVIQNEHDGVITLGEIPEAAKVEAARRVGLKTANLIEKPFCDEPLIEEFTSLPRAA